jgi:hypothetical protein
MLLSHPTPDAAPSRWNTRRYSAARDSLEKSPRPVRTFHDAPAPNRGPATAVVGAQHRRSTATRTNQQQAVAHRRQRQKNQAPTNRLLPARGTCRIELVFRETHANRFQDQLRTSRSNIRFENITIGPMLWNVRRPVDRESFANRIGVGAAAEIGSGQLRQKSDRHELSSQEEKAEAIQQGGTLMQGDEIPVGIELSQQPVN